MPRIFFNLRSSRSFSEEFTSVSSLLKNLLQGSLDTVSFYSKMQAFMLKHSLRFLPDLFRIAIVSAAGTAPVGRPTGLGLSLLSRISRDRIFGRSLVGRHQVGLIAPREADVSPRPPVAAEPMKGTDMCVYCVYLMNIILTVFVLWNLL